MPHGNNLNLHLLIIYKLVHSHICFLCYIPDNLIRIVCKALELSKEKTERQMENRRKRAVGDNV